MYICCQFHSPDCKYKNLIWIAKDLEFLPLKVRNDGRDSGIEEGAMMKSNIDTNDTVSGLDAVEFQVFKNALKCAAFPVLGAPDPPAESTPVPFHRSPMKLKTSPRGKRSAHGWKINMLAFGMF